MLIDGNDDLGPLLERAERDGIEITHVLVTHPHGDHVAGLAEARERARQPAAGRPRRGARPSSTTRSTMTLGDGEKLDAGGLEIEAIYTPGHAAGHLAFLVNGTDVFTADVLFKGTVGGTMAPGASGFDDLQASVMRLMELPPETAVHPGHREPTTIGAEWEGNPFVRIWRGLDETGEEQVHGLGPAGDAEALGARLRRRQQGLGRLRRLRRGRHRRRLPGRARLTLCVTPAIGQMCRAQSGDAHLRCNWSAECRLRWLDQHLHSDAATDIQEFFFDWYPVFGVFFMALPAASSSSS